MIRPNFFHFFVISGCHGPKTDFFPKNQKWLPESSRIVFVSFEIWLAFLIVFFTFWRKWVVSRLQYSDERSVTSTLSWDIDSHMSKFPQHNKVLLWYLVLPSVSHLENSSRCCDTSKILSIFCFLLGCHQLNSPKNIKNDFQRPPEYILSLLRYHLRF